jgi:leucyl/phenylalanyl-tRNA--protein transferase
MRESPIDPGESSWLLPDPINAAPGSDVICLGADLEPSTILAAYRSGMFPMYLNGPDGPLAWWSPDPRGVLPLAHMHISRSLRRSLARFTITVDHAFADVMAACANPQRTQGWITPDFQEAYGRLHAMGWAHSVEVWNRDGAMVGGLYGLEIGGLFAGESMFHTQTDASKVALAGLVDILRNTAEPDRLLDVQWRTPHLASLGVIELPRVRYFELLKEALKLPKAFVSNR